MATANVSTKGIFAYIINLSLLAGLSAFAFAGIKAFIGNLTMLHTGITLVDSLLSGAVALLVTILLVFGFVEKVVPGIKKYIDF